MSSGFKDFRIVNAILCDDIRREINNKVMLIGVYSGDILISELPATVGLAFYLDGEVVTPNHSIEVEIRLSGPGTGKAILRTKFNQTANSNGLTLASPRMEILFEKEGIFKIALREGGPWKTVLSKRVILNPELSNA